MPSTSIHRRAIHPEDLASVILVSDAQLSPDGRTVAFVRTRANWELYYVRTRESLPMGKGP